MLQYAHIIQQQDIEIHFDQIADGITVQQDISSLFYEDLLPKMEILFDELAGSAYTISIQRLDIDCGILSRKHWKEELVNQTLRQLREKLMEKDKKVNKKNFFNAFESFLFFLDEGHLPWNSRVQRMEEMIHAVSAHIIPAQSPDLFKKLLRSNPAVAERLVNNFPADFVWQIIIWLRGEKEADPKKTDSGHGSMSRGKKRELLFLLTETISANETGRPVSSLTGRGSKNPADAKPGPPKKDITDIYIRNAGLVILHPFLPELFRTLQLWDGKAWKNALSQHQAVTLLGYLAGAQEECAELEASFGKILCGMRLDEVLQPMEDWPSAAKPECEELLRQVIHHWSVLRNTSMDALRETFLQREGKLTLVENGWRLNVEQKGVDILLNSLPWGIGTIILPWSGATLYVEWI